MEVEDLIKLWRYYIKTVSSNNERTFNYFMEWLEEEYWLTNPANKKYIKQPTKPQSKGKK